MTNKLKHCDNQNKKTALIYSSVFVILLFLCFLFPYTGDDWAWGSSIGAARLDNWFDNYSGRYFGNLIVLALTRSNLLKTVVMSGVVTGIIVILNELTSRNKLNFSIIILTLVFMPSTLLRQSVVWTSGFANYATSIFLTLIYLYEIKDIYSQSPENNSLKAVLLMILGFSNALIVEHMTFYNVVLGAWVIFYVLIKYKKITAQHVTYFIGACAGTLLMLSNSVYRSIFNGDDSYRSVGDSMLLNRMKNNFLKCIMPDGFFCNCVLMLIVAGVCAAVLYSTYKNMKKQRKVLSVLLLIPIVLYAVLSCVMSACNYSANNSLSKTVLLLLAICTVVYILCLPLFVLTLDIDKKQKLKLLFILGSAYAIILPLFAVTPVGPRCLFAPYVMLIYFAAELAGCIDVRLKSFMKKAVPIFIVAASCGLVFLFYIYADIYNANNNRIEKAIEDSAISQSIEVEELPHNNYVWCSDLKTDIWKTRFKLFYSIDKSVEITVK